MLHVRVAVLGVPSKFSITQPLGGLTESNTVCPKHSEGCGLIII